VAAGQERGRRAGVVSRSGTHVPVGVELGSATPAGWAYAVLEQPLALLVDHAHCELGAAASAQALIRRFPFDHELAERMGALAMEELAHFRAVLRLVDDFAGTFLPPVPNPYVLGLDAAARATRGTGPELLDRLLVSALVEARSCERFELLASAAAGRAAQPQPEHRPEPEPQPEHPGRRAQLAALFEGLGPSERGHMLLFPELARARFGANAVVARLAILQAAESELLARLPFAPRIHSGAPATESIQP